MGLPGRAGLQFRRGPLSHNTHPPREVRTVVFTSLFFRLLAATTTLDIPCDPAREASAKMTAELLS
jgi:hypothetical protein